MSVNFGLFAYLLFIIFGSFQPIWKLGSENGSFFATKVAKSPPSLLENILKTLNNLSDPENFVNHSVLNAFYNTVNRRKMGLKWALCNGNVKCHVVLEKRVSHEPNESHLFATNLPKIELFYWWKGPPPD